jgi:hypothetical protein
LTFLVAGAPAATHAMTTVVGGTLSAAHADQLETWLGVGDQTFTNRYVGVTGDPVAGFHAAVDGVGPTISIFDVTDPATGSTAKIGGYTVVDWGSAAGYQRDDTAFLFNLSSGEKQNSGEASIVRNASNYTTLTSEDYFPTFGLGHDRFGGRFSLGEGYVNYLSYDAGRGNIFLSLD